MDSVPSVVALVESLKGDKELIPPFLEPVLKNGLDLDIISWIVIVPIKVFLTRVEHVVYVLLCSELSI